jgi:hypothetical protein
MLVTTLPYREVHRCEVASPVPPRSVPLGTNHSSGSSLSDQSMQRLTVLATALSFQKIRVHTR